MLRHHPSCRPPSTASALVLTVVGLTLIVFASVACAPGYSVTRYEITQVGAVPSVVAGEPIGPVEEQGTVAIEVAGTQQTNDVQSVNASNPEFGTVHSQRELRFGVYHALTEYVDLLVNSTVSSTEWNAERDGDDGLENELISSQSVGFRGMSTPVSFVRFGAGASVGMSFVPHLRRIRTEGSSEVVSEDRHARSATLSMSLVSQFALGERLSLDAGFTFMMHPSIEGHQVATRVCDGSGCEGGPDEAEVFDPNHLINGALTLGYRTDPVTLLLSWQQPLMSGQPAPGQMLVAVRVPISNALSQTGRSTERD